MKFKFLFQISFLVFSGKLCLCPPLNNENGEPSQNIADIHQMFVHLSKNELNNHTDYYPTQDGPTLRMPRKSIWKRVEKALNREVEEGMKNPLNSDDFKEAENVFERFKSIGKDESDSIHINLSSRSTRNVASIDNRWPDGRIPYVISPGFSKVDRAKIADAILKFKAKTCLKIVQRSLKDKYFVLIYNGNACFSSQSGFLPRITGMSLGKDCGFNVGNVQHEFMHILGFYHEHTRYDRDEYVKVNMDNVPPGKKSDFVKKTKGQSRTLGFKYDYDSIMHYSRGNGLDGKGIIFPKKEGVYIGQRIDFSDLDEKKINEYYGCKIKSKQSSTTSKEPSSTTSEEPSSTTSEEQSSATSEEPSSTTSEEQSISIIQKQEEFEEYEEHGELENYKLQKQPGKPGKPGKKKHKKNKKNKRNKKLKKLKKHKNKKHGNRKIHEKQQKPNNDYD